MLHRNVALALSLAASVILTAQTPPTPPAPVPEKRIGITPEAVVWTEGPPTLPAGSQIAVLEGNPRSAGIFTMRVRVAAGSALAPHWHPAPERVTVLSGAVDAQIAEHDYQRDREQSECHSLSGRQLLRQSVARDALRLLP